MLSINATFIGQLIVLLVLLWFIYKVVTPMLAGPIAERQRKIAAGLAAADAGQKQLADANASAEQIVRAARERAKQIEDQAQRQSNQIVEAAKHTAQSEGARIVQAAQTEIGNETQRARDSLRQEYGKMVVQGASKLIEREIDPATHSQLLDQLTQQIARG